VVCRSGSKAVAASSGHGAWLGWHWLQSATGAGLVWVVLVHHITSYVHVWHLRCNSHDAICKRWAGL
jgi:hypothetical protein